MAPREKVLCPCCGVHLTHERARAHRLARAQPYPTPSSTVELPQHRFRVEGPSSEADMDIDMDAAGLSVRHPSLDGSLSGADILSEDMEASDPGFDARYADADPFDADAAPAMEGAEPSALGAQPHFYDPQPEQILHGHWHGLNYHPLTAEIDPELEDESDDDGSEVRDVDSEGENEDDEPDLFDWDSFKPPALSVLDQLGEEFDREAAAVGHKLAAYDLAICRAFAYKVKSNTSDTAFEMAPLAFPLDPPLPNLHGIRSRVNFLAGFKPQIYDVCTNSCICFVGPYADDDECPHCEEPRWRADGKPRKKFTYIPLIPRLVAFAANRDMATKMQHRAEHIHEPGVTKDVFDGEHYRTLCEKTVEIKGEKLGYKYFSDHRDVALGASWDGFSPFKRRKKTCWPLIMFNYNLPPDVRCLLDFILPLGAIPGAKKPLEPDSFLWPAVEEFLRLAAGVRAFDILSGRLFILRAFLILVFGDIPAVAMFMLMKGHNGISPCRMCNIVGIRVPSTRSTAHYVPLDRSCHPDVCTDPTAVRVYDPNNLPLRTQAQIIAQGKEVQAATSKAEAERLSKQYGVKGVPVLSYLGSLSFPGSFGYDFMHLIWENLVKNLTLLWTGEFKGLDEGQEEYELDKTVWEAVASLTASASDTIPFAYGSRIPNISKDRSSFVSAEMWSFWTLYLGPVLLRRRFKHIKYYQHYIRLVYLLNLCLQFEITDDEVEEIRVGFIDWVQTYEELYYQKDVDRLSTCPLTIHALLHIAASIKFCGPVWCYWAFTMERYCGTLSQGIRSPRWPWASLDRYIFETAQLTQIKVLYNVSQELALKCPTEGIQLKGAFADPDYPTCILLPPKNKSRPDDRQIRSIAPAVSTRTGAGMQAVNDALKDALVEEWGKVRRIDSEAGDTMRACALGTVSEDSRDNTFVRYEMLVDKNERSRRKKSVFKRQTFYGQLTHIYRVHFPNPCPDLEIDGPTTYILAAIRRCVLHKEDPELSQLDIHSYSKTGPLDVIDVTSAQALVGRVPMKSKEWAIIDRSGSLARADWLGEDV